jgi:translation initiation factor IF-3
MIREQKEKINKQIRSKEVRIVGENVESRIVSIEDAMLIADELGLDLVEINSTSNPPICKIIDYSKMLYEKKQKEKLQKQNNKKVKVKEIRFTYNTGTHDFKFKLDHAINFLKEGHKVRAYVFFSGRELNFKDMGEILLLKFVESLIEYGKPEALPKLEGKKLWVMIGPKKQ